VSVLRSRMTGAAPKYDLLLVVVVVALLIVGLMMVYSSTAFWSVNYQLNVDPYHHLVRQLVGLAVGLVALVVLARIDYRVWRRFSLWIMGGAVLLLGLVLALGVMTYGAQRFLLPAGSGHDEPARGVVAAGEPAPDFPPQEDSSGGGSVQPSEFAKLAVIIYLAHWLSSKGDRIRQLAMGLIPLIVLVGLVAALIILQQHLSSAIFVIATAMAMFFIAGGSIWQILASGALGSLPLVVLVVGTEYRLHRVLSFLCTLRDPLSDQCGANYQTVQSLIALASGGVFGLGLGESRQKFGYIPSAHADYVFAVLGEEMGLIGCLVVLGLFAVLAYRGFRVAIHAPDMFGVLLASGITTGLLFQTLVNVAVVTDAVPTTGITLPFISYGGSSLVVSLAGVGLLLSVSRAASSPEPAPSAPLRTLTSETHDFRGRDRRTRLSRSDRRRLVDGRD
jgi:cell division protein FtsW